MLSINPYKDIGNALTLSSTRSLSLAPQLHKIVQEAVRQQAETGYPQAIILSGTSGAGKTHCSMLLLRQLFAVAGGGPETDAFKHLAAAFTVLRSLGSAKTTTNSESSRIVSQSYSLFSVVIGKLFSSIFYFINTGSIYWSTSNWWCSVSNENSLLLFGPNESDPSVTKRKKLSHFLSNVGRFKSRRTDKIKFRGFFTGKFAIPARRWYQSGRKGGQCSFSGVENMSGYFRHSIFGCGSSACSCAFTGKRTVCWWTGKIFKKKKNIFLLVDKSVFCRYS